MKNVTTDEVGHAVRDALDLLNDGLNSVAFPDGNLDFEVARFGDPSNLKVAVFTPDGPQTFRVSVFREG